MDYRTQEALAELVGHNVAAVVPKIARQFPHIKKLVCKARTTYEGVHRLADAVMGGEVPIGVFRKLGAFPAVCGSAAIVEHGDSARSRA